MAESERNQNKQLRIAVFSGAIPSSTFVEALITGLAKHHHMLLFGVVERPTPYASKHITIIKTPRSHLNNLIVTLYRTLFLLIKRPRNLLGLLQEVARYPRFYDQWIWYSKFLPIILYQPDIFHIQWARDVEFYSFLKTRFHIPLVVSLRGAHINYTPIVTPMVADIYRTVFPKVDAFHAVSNAIALEAEHYGAEPSKTKVIHSPVPSEFFDTFSPYRKPKTSRVELVSVGRFHWIKGYRYALDTLHLLLDKHYDVSYTIVGPKTTVEEIAFQVQQLHLEPHFHVQPTMDQTTLRAYLKTKDILLLTSLEEGLANVVLEAMALGIPVISTDCGGMREVVKHKETGWLVPVRDPKAIADAVVEVMETPEPELQRITQHAHDFVKEHFNAEDSIAKFLELYKGVMMDEL